MDSITHLHFYDKHAKKIGYKYFANEKPDAGLPYIFFEAQAIPDVGRKAVNIDVLLELPLRGPAATNQSICNTINWCRAVNPTNPQMKRFYVQMIKNVYVEAINNSKHMEFYKDFPWPRSIYFHAWFADEKTINLHYFIKNNISIDAEEQDNFNSMPFIEAENFYGLFLKSMKATNNRWIVKHPVGERLTLWYSYMLAFSAVTGINTSKIQTMILGNNHRNLRNVQTKPGRLNSVALGNPSKAYQMYLERIFLDMINGRKVI